jgi:NAD(P)-dependent dehydrogenase (short-subunit alcohol dehydrogenase family)
MTRVALVTGGTRGIGFGVARSLAEEGWQLALCGQRPESAVAELVRSFNGQARYLQADISTAADRAQLLDWIDRTGDGIHLLVNNAGRAPRQRADLLEASEASFEELMRVNLQGPYFLTQQVAARMLRAGAARPDVQRSIVFITSVSAEMASVNRGEYCVSKAALAMAAKLFAVRLAEHGIPVYEVRPGIIDTDMTAAVRDLYDQRIASGLVPEKRWGTPADVGKVVAALARGDAPYATGSVIHVDGGLSVPRL